MKNINWTQSIITAIITILVSVSGGMILFNLQSQQPNLTFKTEKILPFNSQTENLTIYHVKIENQGDKLCEEIICEISILPAKIKDINISSNSPIIIKQKTDSLIAEISTSSLNPNEAIDISILAKCENIFPTDPTIKLRAKGIIGEKTEIINDKKELPFTNLLFYISLGVTILTLFVRSFIKSNGIGDKHADDQNKVIAYLCGVHDLDNQVDRLLSLPQIPSYWSEADRLTSIAINSKSKENCEKVKAVLMDLVLYADMANSSKGIIYFNLAKLEFYLENKASSKEFLDKAKKLIPKLLQTRLKIDPHISE